MKKIFLLFMIVLLAGSIFAASITGSAVNKNQAETTQIKTQERTLTQSQIQEAVQVKNRLRVQDGTKECPDDCICTGSTIKCEIDGQREMIISAGKSGNTIVQVKGTDMSTKVELYQSEGEVYGVFKDNTKKIKIMPDEIKTRLTERIGGLEEHEIELDENGEYQIQTKKKTRLFGFIPVRKSVRFEMNSETGEVIRQRTSWWAFLAKEVDEEKIACTKDAKICPDGTAVEREGPDCEFSKCPGETEGQETSIDEIVE